MFSEFEIQINFIGSSPSVPQELQEKHKKPEVSKKIFFKENLSQNFSPNMETFFLM